MKIKYDIPRAHEDYAIRFSLVHMCSIMLSSIIPTKLSHAHRLVAHSRLTNKTDIDVWTLTCGIPYEELCCSVLKSTDPEISKHCVPYIALISVELPCQYSW